jgi:hypothetical protein
MRTMRFKNWYSYAVRMRGQSCRLGEGGDLLQEPVVLVDEALVGGMAKAPRARHLKGLRRDQEIPPLADERVRASTAWPPGIERQA